MLIHKMAHFPKCPNKDCAIPNKEVLDQGK